MQPQPHFQGSRYSNTESQVQIPFGDLPSMFGGGTNFPQPGFFQQQQQLPITNLLQSQQDYHNFNDFFHNSNVNYSNLGNSSNSGLSKK